MAVVAQSDPSGIHIISKGYDEWTVQFQIDVAELLDQRSLLEHLRRVKQKIAAESSVPEVCLVFDGIVEKTHLENIVDAVVRIRKAAFEKGNPTVRFKDGVAADGTHYAQMTALLDILYLDQFEKVITSERVVQTLQDAALLADLIDRKLVAQKIKEVIEGQIPAKNISVATGRFPDLGKDAEIEFFFRAIPEPGSLDVYYSSRRVSRCDSLCRKIPPTTGANAGSNVVGNALPPRSGLDISLKGISGTATSPDGLEITSTLDGVVVVNRTIKKIKLPSKVKEIPESISVKVNPVLKVQGNTVLDIAAGQTVEVEGDLAMGSRIITDCEVFVSGDVEEGTLIQAGDDIVIGGSVTGATLDSQSNVVVRNGVTTSNVTAKEKVLIQGATRQSRIVGDEVRSDSIAGTNLLARTGVSISRVEADEGNLVSMICVGMTDFFESRLRENAGFIQRARENLARIEMLVGKELVERASAHSVQTLLMRFMARNRSGQDANNRKQVEVYRKLLESIAPTKALILHKEDENFNLRLRLKDQEEREAAVVIVRERIASPIILNIDRTEARLESLKSSAEIRANGKGNLQVEPYPKG